MAKKEFVKITPDGLNLLTVLNNSRIAEMNGFYGKEIFFTEGFYGDIQYLFQALGNVGAFARSSDLDIDISFIIISDKIIKKFFENKQDEFIIELENRLNQNNSPYRRMSFISESHLIWYFENRVKLTKDALLDDLIKKYKLSKKETIQQNLF